MAEALSLLDLAGFGYKVITKSILFVTWAGFRYRHARRCTRNINLWTDKKALAWRDSYVATYNAVLVAGAIFANIGLSALQLPDMYTVHWSARALCVASMILGVLPVMMATSQQNALAMLNNPTSIRLWLSRGRPEAYELKGPFGDHVLPITALDLLHFLGNSIRDEGQWRRHIEPRTRLAGTGQIQDKYKDIKPFKGLPLESSMSVLKAVAMPRLLLEVAVFVFMIGFGLYLLFQWVEDIGGQSAANRNVFFVFIISVGTFALYYSSVVSFMVDNQAKKAKEFDLLDLGGPHKPAALEELQVDLEKVQQRMKTLKEQYEDIKG